MATTTTGHSATCPPTITMVTTQVLMDNTVGGTEAATFTSIMAADEQQASIHY